MNIQQFQNLPVITLASFGHNGLDWLHSLLDSHKEIILMPAYSFFRTLDFFYLQEGYHVTSIDSADDMATALTKFIANDSAYQVVRRQFIFNEVDETIFCNSLTQFLLKSNIKNKIKRLFYGIHYAFAELQDLPLDRIKSIVIQEHVSWHCFEYQKIFDDIRFIFMMRDPRAAYAGGWKRQVENAHFKRLNPFDLDKTILSWTYTHSFCASNQFNQDKIMVMQNEKMHNNLDAEMKNLCSWMNIQFEDCCLDESFLGKPWLGESAYLAVDELSERPPEDFYDAEKVEQRWRGRLAKNDILMLEVIFRRSMKRYHYAPDNTLTFFTLIKGFLIYLFRDLTNQNERVRPLFTVMKWIRNFIRRLIILIAPKYANKIFLLP